MGPSRCQARLVLRLLLYGNPLLKAGSYMGMCASLGSRLWNTEIRCSTGRMGPGLLHGDWEQRTPGPERPAARGW